MALLFLHGIVDRWTSSFVDRNYAPRDAFEQHLRSRRQPYGPWENAAQTDHLSVDDSTRAGADACLLARGLGHEVTFFINPEPIETNEPYFFTRLDTFIDNRTVASIEFQSIRYELEPHLTRRQFRRAVKVAAMGLPANDANSFVTQVGGLLGSAGAPVPKHTHPLTVDDLHNLVDCGVRIENHGWSHVEISALDTCAFERHVSKGRDWIQDRLGWSSRLYAVPFGRSDIPPGSAAPLDAYFLARADRPPTRLTDRCWNRRDLTPQLQPS